MPRPPRALEQKVIEAEGGIEGRIAVPGAFGIDEHRPARTDQDVLRADVAVDEGTSGRCRDPDQRVETPLQIAMHFSGGHQIGLEPDGVEAFVRRECLRDVFFPGGCRMDAGRALGDRLRGAFRNDSVSQLVFPRRIIAGIG